jgi:hypothetical protein
MNGADFGIRFRAAVEKPAGSLARTVTLTPLPRIRRALSAVSTLACSASASFSREQGYTSACPLASRTTSRPVSCRRAKVAESGVWSWPWLSPVLNEPKDQLRCFDT